MSAITPHYRTVQQLLQSQSFAIDEYQREYKWERENIDELLSDLQAKFYADYRQGDETTAVSRYAEYFLGSIIVSKRNGKNYLIDGQQRVTSLTLLLICLYRAAKGRGLPVIQTLAPLIFSDNLGQPKFNLDIPERLPVIQALFEDLPFNPDGKDESIQTMYARYADIKDNDLLAELGEALPHFIYWLLTRVGLIEIATDNDSYAYAIFETMNDRGKPLSPVDMLKAYLLAPIEDAQARQMANQTWKQQVLELISWGGEHEPERDANCIKAWLRAQYAESIRERKAGSVDKDWELIGTVFHRWVRDHSVRLGLGKAQANLKLMAESFPFFAKVYRQILLASRQYTPGLQAIYYNAHNDFTWQSTVLLAPLVETDDDETVRRKLAVTATYLDIWLMRRAVNYIRVGYSSVSYAMWLLCRDLRRRPLTELVDILGNKLAEDEVTFEGSPAKGRTGIQGLGLNQFSRRYIYHLLARITEATERGAGRTGSFDKLVDRTARNPFDIEHIWADNFEAVKTMFADEAEFTDWRNHVASLLLLPADVNRSLQDKPFAQKRAHYARQNFYAASLDASAYEHQPKFRQFADANQLPFESVDLFTKEDQLGRRKLVSALVELVWSPSRLVEAAA
ncbi:DUF262 domain-containing protein [Sphaerotilus microaerophilus]|jgi:uncharacterized protein with ParB-like and HNH nuclease domain|uniref:DUF262 domain-containing protein n=1 Tax=Sphaerotilus microaerophilus TaxID=2914710 RepID=A0ABN6PPL5_9BURK|nr:DUF262 domain-containing protein [Sphaerotilus sp. FB-5]BDI05974.1 hypothetical protein CATMQ487_29440 [Sphaerotilus sp. FB-5]